MITAQRFYSENRVLTVSGGRWDDNTLAWTTMPIGSIVRRVPQRHRLSSSQRSAASQFSTTHYCRQWCHHRPPALTRCTEPCSPLPAPAFSPVPARPPGQSPLAAGRRMPAASGVRRGLTAAAARCSCWRCRVPTPDQTTTYGSNSDRPSRLRRIH